jgi:hypothetical protein
MNCVTVRVTKIWTEQKINNASNRSDVLHREWRRDVPLGIVEFGTAGAV